MAKGDTPDAGAIARLFGGVVFSSHIWSRSSLCQIMLACAGLRKGYHGCVTACHVHSQIDSQSLPRLARSDAFWRSELA